MRRKAVCSAFWVDILLGMVNARTQSEIPEKYRPYVAHRQRQQAEMRSRLKARHQLGIQIAQKLAATLKAEFGATKVVLFGSMLTARSVNLRSDIDLAVWDLPIKDYFCALSRLASQAEKFDVDLVRIKEAPDSLRDYILKEGEPLGETLASHKISFEEPVVYMAYGILIGRIRRLIQELDAQYEYAQQQIKVARETDQSAYWNDVAYSLHGFYTGIENIFEQIAREVDKGIDRQDSGWHKALLEQMSIENVGVRPAVISEQTYRYLSEYLKFRHVVRSHYTYRLDPEQISNNMDRLSDCYALVCQQLEDFCEFLSSAN